MLTRTVAAALFCALVPTSAMAGEATVLDKSSGQFTDGSDQDQVYENNLKRSWVIKPKGLSAKARLKVTCPRVDLETGYDFLRIDGKAVDEDAVYTSSAAVTVTFETDHSIARTGFTCRYGLETQAEPAGELDAHVEDNRGASHTTAYDGDALVVRRGVPFALSAPLSKSVSSVYEVAGAVEITDETGDPLSFSLTHGACVDSFCAELALTAGGSALTAWVHPALDAPVGRYRVQLRGLGQDSAAASFHLLFNPFHSGSETYVADAELRWHSVERGDDYVYQALDDGQGYAPTCAASSGAIWVGSSSEPHWTPWAYDQFSKSSLATSVDALSSLCRSQRRSALAVHGHLSWVTHNQLLHGRWDGEYEDGKAPTEWTGSGEILGAWIDTGSRVKYGQCWVFAAVGVTLGRALGLPSRTVTNMDSAHENPGPDFDQVVEESWVEKDGKWSKCGKGGCDSIWNFHVWNEALVERPDLGVDEPVWNAYEGTCQEMSGGRCQCGPATVELDEDKPAYSKYDGDFSGEAGCDPHGWLATGPKAYDKCAPEGGSIYIGE